MPKKLLPKKGRKGAAAQQPREILGGAQADEDMEQAPDSGPAEPQPLRPGERFAALR